jgi:YspA, cpYpsA-related SLOG family
MAQPSPSLRSPVHRTTGCVARAEYITIRYRELDALQESDGPLTVIQGGAPGADALAQRWAYIRAPRQQITLVTMPADWERHGKAAGPIRNAKMLEEKPDLVLAFPGGKGTADLVRKAEKAKVEIRKVGW